MFLESFTVRINKKHFGAGPLFSGTSVQINFNFFPSFSLATTCGSLFDDDDLLFG